MGLGTQPATHRSPMARLVTSATPGDRDQAASARTQHLMLSTPAPRRCASRHAESLLLPALYPRRNPNSGRATKAPDRYHYLGARTSSSTRGPPPSSPLDATSNHPPARPVLDSSRAARRDEQRRWGGSTPTTPLLSVRGCHKGFESPGQLNLPNISGMRKRAQVRLAAPAERRGGFGTCGPGAGHCLSPTPTPNPTTARSGPPRTAARKTTISCQGSKFLIPGSTPDSHHLEWTARPRRAAGASPLPRRRKARRFKGRGPQAYPPRWNSR